MTNRTHGRNDGRFDGTVTDTSRSMTWIRRPILAAVTGLLASTLALSSLSACGTTGAGSDGTPDRQDVTASDAEPKAETDAATEAEPTASSDESGTFTERDLLQSPDLSDATTLMLADGQDVTIDREGTYVVSGSARNSTIVVDVADEQAKIQIVLDGISIENDSAPAIYVKSADKTFVTTVDGTTNMLTTSGDFVADGETNTDAVIFSKSDLTINGLGNLSISSTGNGISGKDDIKITGGDINVTAKSDGIEANDSIAIHDGTISVNATKDGFHAEDGDDDTIGYILIEGGTFSVTAGDDGIQATTYLQIDGGTLDITAQEGLEATAIRIGNGEISIKATDDGINATTKSASAGTPTIEISGGTIAIDMAAGDTDAIDANGDISISGGTVTINSQFAFDYDGTASLTGGTVTVNGTQVSEIQNSMMGGGMMGGGMQHGGQPQGGQSQEDQPLAQPDGTMGNLGQPPMRGQRPNDLAGDGSSTQALPSA